MRTLVVYYSLTGNTRSLGQAIARALDADVEELQDRHRRSGWSAVPGTVWTVLRHQETEIEPPRLQAGDYELVLMGTPVWGGGMAPALRTYLSRVREELPEVAFFATMGGTGTRKLEAQFKQKAGQEPKAFLVVRDKDIKSGNIEREVAEFARKVSASEAM